MTNGEGGLQGATRFCTRRRLLAAPAAFAMLAACARQIWRWARRAASPVVFDGDTLTLDAGLRVRLVEIEAPSEHYSDAYAKEAREVLAAASVGRIAQLFYGGLSRDRYERALAQWLHGPPGRGAGPNLS